jgi:hypothetical protein
MRLVNIFLLVGMVGLFSIHACKDSNETEFDNWKVKLDSVKINDQKYRPRLQEIFSTDGPGTDEYNDLISKQNVLDSINLEIVENMIKTHGRFPGKSILGEEASTTIFLVIQHAPDSIHGKYLDIILDAAKNGQINKGEAAMFHDRYLMYKDLPQIYGSQVVKRTMIDSISGEEIDSTFVWPIRDTTNIDSLRLWNGMGPLNRYLQYYGVTRNNIRIIQ